MNEEVLNIKKRYAELFNLTLEEVDEKFKAETAEELLQQIKEENVQRINEHIHLNREQRRKLKKKAKHESRDYNEVVSDTAKKLSYIELIQRLRELNAKQEKEIMENDATENN